LGRNLKVVADDSSTASARRALARFELAAIRRRNVVRARLGLGDDELTTLLYLLEHPRLTQRELVAISTLTRSGVGAMVQRLEDAGLIERVPDPADRRVRLLQLSARGSRRLREACGACDDAVERVLATRPEDELRALGRLLTAVADATEGHAAEDAQPPVSATRDWRRWG
jgi:DNA-binding MarR family transcriptional regulator